MTDPTEPGASSTDLPTDLELGPDTVDVWADEEVRLRFHVGTGRGPLTTRPETIMEIGEGEAVSAPQSFGLDSSLSSSTKENQLPGSSTPARLEAVPRDPGVLVDLAQMMGLDDRELAQLIFGRRGEERNQLDSSASTVPLDRSAEM